MIRFVLVAILVIGWSMDSRLEAQTPSVPSLPETGATSGAAPPLRDSLAPRRSSTVPDLPKDAGQYYQEYDLKPYTQALKDVDRPQQAIMDWVLRDTGTDAWFADPFGFISADRNKLRVWHNKQMQDLVAGSRTICKRNDRTAALRIAVNGGRESQLENTSPHFASKRAGTVTRRSRFFGHKRECCDALGFVARPN